MMFSLSFAVLLLTIFGVNGQASDTIEVDLAKVDKGYRFGKLRLSADGKTEELIASDDTVMIPPVIQSQTVNDKPLSSPCTGTSSMQKLPYLKDQTKYILCRDEFHYEILTCPNGGEFNGKLSSCEVALPLPIPNPVINRCEQEKPCLYDGQCTLLSNSSFLCTCTPGWTGSRCEIPLNSCSKKPCGPGGECHIIKTTDYEKDYACICNERSTYGINCQDVMPNPCLTINDEFFPYAFSQHAYIQCDGDIMFVQPCGSLLYWNQDDKICDRKRPKKIDFQKLLIKLSLPSKNDHQQPIENEIVVPEIFSTTVGPSEQQAAYIKKGREMSRSFLGFAPARVINRQQVQMDVDNQQNVPTQNAREMELKTQESIIPLSQYEDSNQMRQDLSKPQQWSNQLSETVVQQPVVIQSERNQLSGQTSLTPQKKVVPNPISAMTRESNTEQLQMRQNSQQQNQAFDTQQWSNQVPDMKMQNIQRFISPTPPRQDSQSFSHQEELTPSFLAATSLDTKNRFSTNMQQNNQFGMDQQADRNQQTFKNSGNNEVRQMFSQFETAPLDVQRSSSSNDRSFVMQSTQTQQQPSTFNLKVSTDLNNGQLQRGEQSQFKQEDQSQQEFLPQTQSFGTKQWLNQIPDATVQNSQRFVAPPQPRQVTQTDQKQPKFFAETPTTAQRMTNSQGLQNSQNQEQSWQTQVSSQPVQSPPIKTQSQQYNPLPSMVDSFRQTENNQYGLNQQRKILPTQNSYEQKQPWSNSQQYQTQGSQMTNSDDFEQLPAQNFNTRPMTSSQPQSRSAAGQFTPNLMRVQSSYDWQPNRPVEQLQDNIHVVQTTADQQKMPSWTVARS